MTAPHLGRCLGIATIICCVGCNQAEVPESGRAGTVGNDDTAVSGSGSAGETDLADWGPSAAAGTYNRLFSIVVGIDDYGREALSAGSLRYAVNDAVAVRDLLENEFGFLAENQKVLLNSDAKRAAVIDALTHWLPAQELKPTDAILFFFAGHGEIDRDEGYLIPVDGKQRALSDSYVAVSLVCKLLDALPCRHKAIVLDCCYSGSLFQTMPASTSVTSTATPSVQDSGAVRGSGQLRAGDPIRQYLAERAFWGMSAGRKTPVADGNGENQHSVFTAAFLQALRERADSTREDHAFTFRQLAIRVEALVIAAPASRQVPDSGSLGPYRGDFVFFPTVRRKTPQETSKSRELALQTRAYADDLAQVATWLDGETSSAPFSLYPRFINPKSVELQSNLHGFEWLYLWRRSHRRIIESADDMGAVIDLVNLDGGRVALIGSKKVGICDVNAGSGIEIVWSIDDAADAGNVVRVTRQKDGFIVVRQKPRTPEITQEPLIAVELWSLVPLQLRGRVSFPSPIAGYAMSPDGRLCWTYGSTLPRDGLSPVVAAKSDPSDQTFTIWDVVRGQAVLIQTKPQFHPGQFSPDGSLYADVVRQQMPPYGRTIRLLALPSLDEKLHLSTRHDRFTFSPDGRYLIAVQLPQAPELTFQERALRGLQGLQQPVDPVCSFQVYACDTGKCLIDNVRTVTEWVERGDVPTFTDDNTSIVFPNETGTVTLMALPSGSRREVNAKAFEINGTKKPMSVNPIKVSDDGSLLAVGRLIIDLASGDRIGVLPGAAASKSTNFTSDHKHVVRFETGRRVDPHTRETVPRAALDVISVDQCRLHERAPPSRLFELLGADQKLELLASSATGSTVVIANDDSFQVREVETAALTARIPRVTPTTMRSQDRGGVALSHDGAVVAIRVNHSVQLWDSRTGAIMRDIVPFRHVSEPRLGPNGGVLHGVAAAITSDHKLLATGAGPECVLWDALTGRERFSWTTPAPVVRVAFSRSGRMLAHLELQPQTRELAVIINDTTTGKEVLTCAFPRSTIATEIKFSVDESKLWLAGQLETIREVSGSNWKAPQPIEALRLKVAEPSGDFRLLAGVNESTTGAGSGRNSTGIQAEVHLWDLRTGEHIGLLGKHSRRVLALAFSEDGEFLAAKTEERILKRWRIRNLEELPSQSATNLAFERFGIGFNPIEFSSAGEVLEGMNPLAFCVAPIPIGFTAGWSNAAKTEQFEVQPLRIDGISRSGKFMATRIGQRIGKATHPEQTITRIWNIETGDEWMAPSEKVRRGQACAFSPINDSVIILTPTAKSRGEASMSDLILWNLESQESRQICSGLIPTDPSPEIVFSIDGRLIFCTCLQGTVNGPAIVDVTNGEYVASLSRGSGIVTAFASVMFTPDGKRLLTHSYSGAVELWDVVTGVRVFELGNVPTASYRISVASDGNAIIAYSRDREKGSVIWRAATSEELQPAMKAP